jgi:hypothetical protein
VANSAASTKTLLPLVGVIRCHLEILPSVGAAHDEDHHRRAHGAGQCRENLNRGDRGLSFP